MPERLAITRSRVPGSPSPGPAPKPHDLGLPTQAVEAARAGQPLADPATTSTSDVLALQRSAGNRAVVQALAQGVPVQAMRRPSRTLPSRTAPRRTAQRIVTIARIRAPRGRPATSARPTTSSKATAQRAPTGSTGAGAMGGMAAGARAQQAGANPRQAAHNDMVDFLNGFQELVGSAVNDNGRTLYGVKFGPDTGAAHLKLLERVRRVLIKGHSPDPTVSGAARAEWPKLAAQLTAELGVARTTGIRANQTAHIENQIAYIGESYLKIKAKGPSELSNPDDVKELLDGIQALLAITDKATTDRTTGVVELNRDEQDQQQRDALSAVKFGPNLSKRHRRLLEGLRETLKMARTKDQGGAALAKWNTITADLKVVFDTAGQYVSGDTNAIRGRLARLAKELIHGGAYSEAHQAAMGEATQGMVAPDHEFQINDLKAAIKEAEHSTTLADKAFEMTGKSALDEVLKDEKFAGAGAAIYEMVKSPGEVIEAIQKFREQSKLGKAATIGDIADKVRGWATAVAKVAMVSIRTFAETALNLALKSGVMEKAVRWGKIANWASNKIEILEKIEKAKVFNKVKILTVVTVVISAIKVADYISKGQWGKALEEVATTGLSLAAAALAPGLAGTAMVSGIAVILWAQAEGLAGAAAMIRYCKKANIRGAAGDFVSTCMQEYNGGARHFIADIRMLDSSSVVERPIVEKNLNLYAPYWQRAMDDLAAQFRNDRVIALGGQPALKKALGDKAYKMLQNHGGWNGDWKKLAEEVYTMFEAANNLAKYVEKNYPRRESTEGESD